MHVILVFIIILLKVYPEGCNYLLFYVKVSILENLHELRNFVIRVHTLLWMKFSSRIDFRASYRRIKWERAQAMFWYVVLSLVSIFVFFWQTKRKGHPVEAHFVALAVEWNASVNVAVQATTDGFRDYSGRHSKNQFPVYQRSPVATILTPRDENVFYPEPLSTFNAFVHFSLSPLI